MSRNLVLRPRGLFVEVLEARVNPAFFTARTDLGPVQWSNPAAWSDDPASTEVPGPGDSVIISPGDWDIDLGGGEVVIDSLDTIHPGGAPDSITIRNGNLRLMEASHLGNDYYSEGDSAPPLLLALEKATLIAGEGPVGTPGQIVVNTALRMDGVVAEAVHLSVTGQAKVFGGHFKKNDSDEFPRWHFKSVSVAEGGELLTFGTTRNAGGLAVGLSTGSLVSHGTLAGAFGGNPGYLYATDMTNHGYADLSGGARLSGDLVNHTELRVSGPTVHAANLTNSKDAMIGVDGRPLDPGYPAIVVAGTAKLDGKAYDELMGLTPTDRDPGPYVADFLRFSKLEGRFRELVTPEPDSTYPSSGLRDPDAKLFVGLDYELDRVSFSLIDVPYAPPPLSTFPAPAGATGLVVTIYGIGGEPDITTAQRIRTSIPANRGLWDVVTLDWREFTEAPELALSEIPSTKRIGYVQNGYDVGRSLACWFRNQVLTNHYNQFHVVGYSMGVWVADGFVDGLHAMGLGGDGKAAPVHLTLHDAYVPTPTLGEVTIPGRPTAVLQELGETATWAEQYVDLRDIGVSTNYTLPNAYNIDVSQLDDGRFLEGPVYDALYRGHFWVHDWYFSTADFTSGASARLSHGWGFPIAPEYAGTSPSHDVYPRKGYLLLTLDGSPTPTPMVRTTAVGAGARVFVVGPDGKVASDFAPFGDTFTGQVRTAAADFNGDGVADLVAGTGPGGPTRVIVFDGTTRTELFSIDPFEASFTGGVYVAAGDLNGDGKADLVITPDEGGGPRARVFSGNGFVQLADFFGIEDVSFRGGARPAIGDITGDGKADLVVAAGFGGGPRVGVFDGAKLAAEGGLADQGAARWNTWKPFGDFLAFEPALRNGTFVAVGDLDGDHFADLIAGGGPGGGPRVTAFNGSQLLANTQTAFVNFFAGDVNNRGGVRVSVKNLDGDAKADLVVGAGTGGGSRVTGYLATTLTTANPTPTFDFDALAGFTGGVFVG